MTGHAWQEIPKIDESLAGENLRLQSEVKALNARISHLTVFRANADAGGLPNHVPAFNRRLIGPKMKLEAMRREAFLLRDIGLFFQRANQSSKGDSYKALFAEANKRLDVIGGHRGSGRGHHGGNRR